MTEVVCWRSLVPIGRLIVSNPQIPQWALIRTDQTQRLLRSKDDRLIDRLSIASGILCLASGMHLCNNYVMRSSRDVVEAGERGGRGYYSDPPLLVLVSLISGPKHGHAMIDDILHLCGTRLGAGTLYGAIARLENQGWIEPLPPEKRRYPYASLLKGFAL
jgi:hypothetical protein